MSEIIWKDPPARTHARGIAVVLPALKERPGQWALIKQDAKPSYRSAVYAASKRYPDFEFRTVATDHDTVDVYGRFVGDEP